MCVYDTTCTKLLQHILQHCFSYILVEGYLINEKPLSEIIMIFVNSLTLRTNLSQFHPNTRTFFIQIKAYENIICKTSGIFFVPKCVTLGGVIRKPKLSVD